LGGHILSELNNKLIQIVENLGTKRLPTGETVRICKVKYWVEELGQWISKKHPHTFWPSGWDMNKIKQVCTEASENITFRQGNKFEGLSKSGIKIQFYVDEATKQVSTAYIIF
jgi:hypothetical protein